MQVDPDSKTPYSDVTQVSQTNQIKPYNHLSLTAIKFQKL